MTKSMIIGIVFCLICINSFTESLYVKDGNIFCEKDKEAYQLTNSGINNNPVLSPDGNKIVFTRKSNREADLTTYGDDPDPTFLLADQLWIMDSNGKNQKMLVEDCAYESGEQVINHIRNIHFALDSKSIFFCTDGWNTSDALHQVNIDGTGEHFVTSSCGYEIINTGDNKNNLKVSLHLYGDDGSYHSLRIFSPEGKELVCLDMCD